MNIAQDLLALLGMIILWIILSEATYRALRATKRRITGGK